MTLIIFRYYSTIISQKESSMNALERLQGKIEELKNSYEGIQQESSDLRTQLEEKENSCTEKQNTIDLLRYELEEKDREIEEIITKVEALLA